jgi:hypothetical protein
MNAVSYNLTPNITKNIKVVGGGGETTLLD